MSHTTGPWAFRTFGGRSILVADYGPRNVVLIATLDKGRPIFAQRDQDGVLCEFDPKSHDANLLAAAPEMYEALKAIQVLALPQATHIQKICSDAIAKAEGKL